MRLSVRLPMAVVLVLFVAGAPGDAQARAARTVVKSVLRPGVTLTRIRDPSGPFEIRVIRLDPSTSAMLDVALAGRTFGSFAKPSSMAAREGAVAAVNGDFSLWPGRPVHPFADDTLLDGSGWPEANVAPTDKEKTFFANHAAASIVATDRGSGTNFRIQRWNTGVPGRGQIAGYTWIAGGRPAPPDDACSARLFLKGDLRWGPRGVGITRDYRVGAVNCQSSPMPMNGGIVLSAKRSSPLASASIRSLRPEEIVSITWTMKTPFGTEWPRVTTTIGGMPLIVFQGRVTSGWFCGNGFCDRNPRTAIGYTADGTILLVTVDGRRPGWSVGMTMAGLAHEMIALGAVNAVNLDGGGSTVMWVAGQGLVDRPSDPTGERPVSTSILVLPQPESEPVPALATGVVSPSEKRRAWGQMESDPASTGGMADAVVRGAGSGATLPRALVAAARRFESRGR